MSATKHDGEKPRYELIPYHHWPEYTIARKVAEWYQNRQKFPEWDMDEFLDGFIDDEDVAKVMEMGARKYSAWNWRQGFSWSRIVGALLRHWSQSGSVDDESGLPHEVHCYVNYLFLRSHVECGLGRDDRP